MIIYSYRLTYFKTKYIVLLINIFVMLTKVWALGFSNMSVVVMTSPFIVDQNGALNHELTQ